MGCWNETCALTGLPITDSCEAVMVVFREPQAEEKKTRTPDIDPGLDDYLYIDFKISEIFELKYETAKYFHLACRGKYSGYGSIEGVPEDKYMSPLDGYVVIFTHASAWDEAVKFFDQRAKKKHWYYKDVLSNMQENINIFHKNHLMHQTKDVHKWQAILEQETYDIIPEEYSELFWQAVRVIHMAHLARRDLRCANEFRGSQLCELDVHKMLSTQTTKILSQMRSK